MRVWDAATGRPRGDPLTAHTSYVQAVTMSSSWVVRPGMVNVLERVPATPTRARRETRTRVAHLPDGRRRAGLDELLAPGPSSPASIHHPASSPGTPFLVAGAAAPMARIRARTAGPRPGG